MSYANGIITSPVNQNDIQQALGISSSVNKWSKLCTHVNINKWAMYKPERFPINSHLSLANRKSNMFSLLPKPNNKALAVCNGYGGTTPEQADVGASGYTIDDIAAANQEWEYLRPNGNNSPYRILDYQGYLHPAREAVAGWQSMEVTKDLLATVCRQALAGTQDVSEGATAWKLTCSTCNPFQLSCRMGDSSSTYIGGGGGDQIPLSAFFGTNDNWRLGIGVFVDDERKMHFFASNWPLRSVTGTSNAYRGLPSLETNQFLCEKLLLATGSATSKTFTAIPLMFKNCTITQGDINGRQLTLLAAGIGLIYSSPSNNTVITITVKGDGTPYVSGVQTWPSTATSDGVFIVGAYNTGSTAGTPPNTANIQQFAAFLATGRSFTGTKTLYYDFTYTYGVGGSRQTGTLSGQVSISNDNTITYQGQTYVAVNIGVPQPALEITSASHMTYV